MIQLAVGQRFSRDVTIDEDSIREFARLAGDENPLHHDKELALDTCFGGLIASGTHSAAIMMGAMAAVAVRFGPALGLEFGVKFKKPVKAGERIQVAWEVSAIEEKPGLDGSIVSFTGRIINREGETAVTGWAKSLILNNANALLAPEKRQ